jgi:membrane protein DedA with SNARE-associated domain
MTPTIVALIAGTLVSEDATCLLAAVLIQRGAIDWPTAIAACAFGIWAGDLALWCAGRALGAAVLQWPRVARVLDGRRRDAAAQWVTRHAAGLILGSRFTPGTRLPLYLAFGAFGTSPACFAAWSFVAVVIWTPAVVLLAAWANPGSTTTAIAMVMAIRVALAVRIRRNRQRAVAVISRLWRWEFWPMWIFYAPVAAWVAWLTVRYRGIAPLSAANPGMTDGGIVGESKHAIVGALPRDWTIPAIKIDKGEIDARLWQLAGRLTTLAWSWPLIFKPDVGQRGAGVKLVPSLEGAREYLQRERGAVLVQPFHPGPYEAGVFYYRMPSWPRGRIFSITDKHFPRVAGDGRSTLEELIWSHPRLRMQARTFLSRHAMRRHEVLGSGEVRQLAIAGNHAQGTLFRDGRHLITPALEDRIDRIAQSVPGFFVGRFDIRYSDVEKFKAGEDLAIVELNGATAESTNIYDPSGSLLSAYRQLFRQWSLVFAIGAVNRAAGAPVSSLSRIVALIRAHAASELAYETSD